MALEVGFLNIKDEINRLRCPGFAARFLYDLGEKSLAPWVTFSSLFFFQY